jgi:hypothetical protein
MKAKQFCLIIVLIIGWMTACRNDSDSDTRKPSVLLDQEPLAAQPVSQLIEQETTHGMLVAPHLDDTLECLSETKITLHPEIISVTQKGGRYYHAVALDDHRFAVASLRGTDFFDIRTNENQSVTPYLQVNTPGDAWSLEIVDSTIWVADGYAGLTILDIATGAQIGRYPELEHVRAFHTMHDGRVIICRHRQGADIAVASKNGTTIESLTHIDAGERVFSATSDKNRVFLGTLGAGYRAYDVQDGAPTHLWTYKDTSRIVWCKYLDGYHYLLDQDAGLMIVKDNGDKNPDRIGFLELPGQSRHACFIQENRLLIANQHGAYIIDIHRLLAAIQNDAYNTTVSYSENPYLHTYEAAKLDGRGVATIGDYIVFSASEFGIRIMKFENESIQTVSMFEHNGLVSDIVFMNDGRAVMAHSGQGVALLEACDVLNPVELFRWTDTAYPVSVAVMNNVLAVADYEGILLLEISSENTLQKRARLKTPGRAVKVVFRGDHLLVADWFDGVHIVSFDDIDNPRIISTIPVNGWATDVAVKNNTAYICSVTEGLLIATIEDITAPRILFVDTTASAPEAVTLTDDAMYVADFNFGLLVFNIKNPSLPDPVASYRLAVAKNVSVRNSLLLVSNYIYGVKWFDITQPLKPALIGEVDTPGKAYKAAFCGDANRILLADWHDLTVIEW